MKMSELSLPDGVELHATEMAGQLASDLAAAVAAKLEQRLETEPRVSLLVSGGSTPVPFFWALREKPLDWRRVDICLVDERWVEEGSDHSNTALVRQHLLQGPAALARYISLKQPGATPEAGLAATASELEKLTLPPDVLVLGMGNDGHTASLFPDAPELPQALAAGPGAGLVAAMNPGSQPQARVTLTARVLTTARFTALLIRGEDKLDTLADACRNLDKVPEMPVRLFLKPGLHVYWSP